MQYTRTVAALVAVMVVGGLGFVALTGGATATVDSFTIDDDSVTSDDGSFDSLKVSGSGSYEFDGLDAEADRVVTTVEVQNPDGSWSTLVSDSTDVSGYAGTVSGPLSANVLTDSQWTKSDLESTTDGESETTSLKFRLTIEVKSGGGSTLASDQAQTQADFTVNNEALSTSATADGTLDGSATDDSP